MVSRPSLRKGFASAQAVSGQLQHPAFCFLLNAES
jgi:hypothetical protein